MPAQGRLGDKANVALDAHGCPACPHPAIGPAIQGSPDVNVNRRPALRVDDPGVHAACCGPNTWTATRGSATVFINGKGAHRLGDQNRHCGGMGQLVEGSPNVVVGEATSGGAGAGASRASAAGGPGAATGTGGASGPGTATRGAPGTGATAPASAPAAGAAPATAPRPGPPDPARDEYQLECALVTSLAAPCRAERFEITLPDGSQKLGTSGGDGVIRLSGLTTPGTARLVLPGVDARFPERWQGTQGTPYARGGVTIPVGASQVSVPPLIYRGRMTGMLFDTDKSFLLPSAMPGIRELKRFYDEHPGFEVMVSGHADRQGSASHNLALSVDRAEAIGAFLQDDVSGWMPWYGAAKPAGQRWGVREDQHMLTALGHYGGPVHGRSDPATRDAVTRFRLANNLGAGPIDDATRQLLVEQYMQLDGTTLPAGTRIQHHGCGEYHPEVETRDGAAERENRRVELFFFEGPIDPAAPASCPPGGCTQYPAWRQRTVETVDVNAAHEVTFTLLDELGQPLQHAALRIRYPDGETRDATTDERGTFVARVMSGDSLELEIDDSHEAGAGDGLTTSSGTHLHAGGAP